MTDDYTLSLNLPFSIGVYVAVNALPDAFLFMDAPSCAIAKAKYVYGNHDLMSTLLDKSGCHRVVDSSVNICTIPIGRDEDTKKRLRKVASLEACQVILISAFHLTEITGIQYDALARQMEPELKKPVLICG